MIGVDARATIEEVVSVFETGHLRGPQAYGACVVNRDGAGLSYGVHQGTAEGGTLEAILVEHARRGGGLPGFELSRAIAVAKTTIGQTQATISAEAEALAAVLRGLGGTTTMKRAQDDVFGRLYYDPAETYADDIGLVHPLSVLVLFDTAIQSGMGRITRLRRTFKEGPPSKQGREDVFIRQFLRARKAFLELQASDIARSVYRVEELQRLVLAGAWGLERPLRIREVLIA